MWHVILGGAGFWVAQRFTACGKSHQSPYRRGRAALQGRVSRLKSAWALAPVVVLPRQIAFFRKLFSAAVIDWC
jgi:hypothetical protein